MDAVGRNNQDIPRQKCYIMFLNEKTNTARNDEKNFENGVGMVDAAVSNPFGKSIYSHFKPSFSEHRI